MDLKVMFRKSRYTHSNPYSIDTRKTGGWKLTGFSVDGKMNNKLTVLCFSVFADIFVDQTIDSMTLEFGL
jgi:hypothetical protein